MEVIESPFKDLKVLDLSTVLAGPAAGMFFAELGAVVIKVEQPLIGDVTRSWVGKNEVNKNGISAYFSAVNWGKKSITLSFTDKNDRIIIEKLILWANVILVNLKPGDDVKFNLTPTDIEKINPSIVYGRISGYGSNDSRVGYDAIIQAESGFMYMNGLNTSSFHKMPVALVDILAAHQLKEGILVALYQQLIHKKSYLVEVSLLDAALSSLANQGTNWLMNNADPQPSGSEHPNIAPYGTMFFTLDKHAIVLAVGSDKQFFSLCEILNIENKMYQTNAERVKNRESLNKTIQSKVSELNCDTIIAALTLKKIPVAKVNMVSEALSSTHAENLMLIESQIKSLRTIAFNHSQKKLSAPPKLDEHRDEILRNLGY